MINKLKHWRCWWFGHLRGKAIKGDKNTMYCSRCGAQWPIGKRPK